MSTMAERICLFLENNPGMTDREIADVIIGQSASQQPINSICRTLTSKGILVRRHRKDGLIGNYLLSMKSTFTPELENKTNPKKPNDNLSEDDIKKSLERWLIDDGWQVQVAAGHDHGVGIDARKGNLKWIIEVKGSGPLQPIRVNYFLGALGELLQRMDEADVSYSIAFPDIPQFRGLWERLPALAKKRIEISVLFVDAEGKVVRM